MPTKYKDYPIYTYNEPATYNDFTGGINTDPSNEHLLDNEMRDCVNMTYLSGALVKRKGAKEICKITCDEDIKNIQGVFLFTYKITYIIVAADGKLYQAVFNENTTLNLTRLNIFKLEKANTKAYDEESVLDGIETLQKTDIIPEKHEGFLQEYFKSVITNEVIQLNKRDSWKTIESGMIEKGDYFEYTEGIYKTKYVCIKDFEKTIISLYNTEYWEPYSDEDSVSIKTWTPNTITEWTPGTVVTNGLALFRCIKRHFNRENALNDPDLFVKSNVYSTDYAFYETLVFQNYRKIEAATFNNKLFIMTGTRIVTVSIEGNELVAKVLAPHICNNSEIVNIGYNYISPYPELALATQTNTVTTSISQIAVRKLITGKFLLEPIMNIQIGDSINNYWFRWEKKIENVWYTIIPFRIQDPSYQKMLGLSSDNPYTSIEVEDADSVQYRVTFAKAFETPDNIINDEWEYTEGNVFEVDLILYNNGQLYRCIKTHPCDVTNYPDRTFNTYYKDTNGNIVELWEEYRKYETVNYTYQETVNHPYEEDGVVYDNPTQEWIKTTTLDYKIDEITGDYFGQAVSIIWKDLDINDTFNLIHSCTKILVDGNKLLYYGDNYNSGQWFKTIINNPGYITDRGSLSFKTTKNEQLLKAIPFQGNIICFANSDNVGGSIHIVTGNGDDYDASDGYYSPYQRRTINSTVSSDNENTIQVCDNILIFKYFKKLYYINASDLSNDVIKVNQCNTRVSSSNNDVTIPWDDNSCISEVTNDYYALIWKEKFLIDDSNNLVQERPGIRLKLYFNMTNQLEDKTYTMPWLRDESKYFNVDNILYFKGRSLMLYNNIIISFNEDTYEDLNEIVPCIIKLKGEELGYAKISKLISNIMVYYFRNQHSKIDFDLITRNEAGHIIYNSKNKLFSINDLKNFKEKDVVSSEKIRVDSTIQDTKMFTVTNKFPCLLAESTITAENKGSFSLSSITYYYDTIDMPDSNPYDAYTNIIRPEEVK